MQFDLDSSDGIQQVSIQSIVESGQAAATFMVYARNAAIGNNKSMLSIVNTSGSPVVLRLRELYIVNTQNAAVTGIISNFEMRRCVSHSGGTLLKPLPFDSIDSLNASITARTGATIGSEAADMFRRWNWSSDDWSGGAPDTESADHPMQVATNLVKKEPYTKPFTLRANEGLTIKHTVNSTNGTFDVCAVFTQEAT